MADILLPIDVGRVTHMHLMHRSEDENGDAIPEGFLLGADGSKGHTFYDPSTILAASGPFYNVRDYGALGDGTTDDTSAIEDTFDAADATGGGVIYFPPTANYYKITTLITRTGTSKYHLLGGAARYGSARIHQATANTGAFKFAPSSGTANRVLAPIVENLTISGAGGASSGKGIEFDNDGHVQGCFVYGFHTGIYLANESYYSVIRNTTVTDCDLVGIHLNATNNTTIDSCRLTGLFSTGSAPIGVLNHGIIVTGGFAQRILNSSIEYFTGYGIAVEGGGPITIQGNYFETQQSTTGFAHLWLGNTSQTYNAWVVSNYFQGDGIAGFNAIKLDNAVAFHIHANRFGINSAIGIAHGGGSSGGFAWGNTNSPAGTFTLPSDTITSPGGMANPMTTAGDLIYGGVSGAPTRRAVGTTGQALIVSSGNPAWATAAGDVSGQYTALSVDKVKGVAITDAGSTGTVLTKTGALAATWQTVSTVAALDDLTDVVITSATADDTLRFNGTNWVNDARNWEAVTDGEDVFVWDGDDLVHDWST